MNIHKHEQVVEFVHSHPVFKGILDDNYLNDLAKKIEENEPNWPKTLEIYCHIIEDTRSNLDTLEIGLRFIIETVSGQPKSDFINRLKDVNNVGTVFETCLIGALYRELKNNVYPYPDIGNRQRVEAKLTIDELNLFLEASVLNFSEADLDSFRSAESQGGISVTSLPGTGEGRVIQKIEEKFKRYNSDERNILLLSQYSCLPLHDCGIEAVKSYLHEYGKNDSARNFCGIFYFDRFECLAWIENKFCKKELMLNSRIVNILESAFSGMIPCNR
ncbi:MAG: hypothetical protein JXD22_12600 [Sedimentisphaerales bacterium]|nr:hypothetical protein [Sedimentisphaerales bacterium]